MEYLTQTEKIYLDQSFATIKWIAEGNCLHIEWKSEPTTESFNEVLAVQRHIIRKYGCTKVVVTNKSLKKSNLADVAI
jgi:hypothetical protein